MGLHFQSVNLGSCFLDHACAFMTQDLIRGSVMFICSAETAMRDLDDHLVALQRVLMGC